MKQHSKIKQPSNKRNSGDRANRFELIRFRIQSRIEIASAFPIVAIIAPAGFGKTTALRQFVATIQHTISFTIPKLQNLQHFVTEFAKQCSALFPEMAAPPDALPEAGDSRQLNVYVAWAISHLREANCTIAIDDVHLLEQSPGAIKFLVSVIDATKKDVTWILSTRERGSLPYNQWQAYGDLGVPISVEDLRLTTTEAAEFAALLKSPATLDDLERWIEQTNGYFIPISYAIRSSAQRGTCNGVMDGTRSITFDFIAQQIWASLSENDRTLLQIASLLPPLHMHHYEDAGLDKASLRISELGANTAFISVTVDGIFTLHQLFRDFILQNMMVLGPETSRARRQRAVDVLLQASRHEDAIRMLADSLDITAISAILEKFDLTIIDNSLARAVVNLCQDIPLTQLGPQMLILHVEYWSWSGLAPRASIFAAEVLHRSDGTSKQYLKAARAIFKSINFASRDEQDDWLNRLSQSLGKLEPPDRLVAESYLASFLSRDHAKQQTAHDSINRIVGASESILDLRSLADVQILVSTAYFYLDKHADSLAFARLAVRTAILLEDPREKARALNFLGILQFDNYDAEVSTLFEDLRTSVERSGCWAFSHVSHWIPALYFSLSGNAETAKAASELHSTIPYTEMAQRAHLKAFRRQAFYLRSILDEQYLAVIQDDKSDEQPVDDYVSYELVTALSACHALIKDFAASETSLKRARKLRESLSRSEFLHVLDGVSIEIIILGANGKWRQAMQLFRIYSGANTNLYPLEKALERFCDGPPFAGLMQLIEACSGKPFMGLSALVMQRVISQLVDQTPDVSLSAAETDVLKQLCLGKSNKAIANARTRSPETIKRQVTSIYRKLGVENRTAALAVAKERGLI